jgi:hypothetical protein
LIGQPATMVEAAVVYLKMMYSFSLQVFSYIQPICAMLFAQVSSSTEAQITDLRKNIVNFKT